MSSLTVDSLGNIFIADRENYRIRKVDTTGIINTVAGNGIAGFSGDGGSATSAQLSLTESVTVDALGNIYIADYNNSRIRKINSSGIISTVAGGGVVYGDGGIATAADIHTPGSVAADAMGNIFIADIDNHRIRKVSGNVLPLTLLQFTAAQDNKNILTTWQTDNEINTESFAVQRSKDGITFTTIGTVKAALSNVYKKNYSYTDTSVKSLNSEVVFYKLRMLDKDHKETYSNIIKIFFINNSISFHWSPNPTKGTLYVQGINIKLITISDNIGRILLQKRANSSQTTINISALPKGIYTVNAYNDKGIMNAQKLLVQ